MQDIVFKVTGMQNTVRELETSVTFLSSKYQDIVDSGPGTTSTGTQPLQQIVRSQGEQISRVAASADEACSQVRKLEECLASAPPPCTNPSPQVHPKPAQALGTCQASMYSHSYSGVTATYHIRPKAARAATGYKTHTGSGTGTTDQALQTTVTSCYQRPARTHDRLRDASWLKCKAVYVGCVDVSCSANAIAKWCEDGNVTVVKCSVLVSAARYFDLAYAHLVIWLPQRSIVRSEKVQSADFWPSGITDREWRFNPLPSCRLPPHDRRH
eukprot:scpid42233/ scgid19519/ 